MGCIRSLLRACLCALSLPATAAAQGYSAELYGMALPPADSTAVAPDSLSTTLGFGVYTDRVFNGFLVGVDMMSTGTPHGSLPDETVDRLSLMAVLRRDFQLGDALTLYAGAGVGAVRDSFSLAGTEDTATALGGQVMLGMRYGLGDSVSAFGEVKYQAADAGTENPGTPGSGAALVGLQFGF